MLSYCPLSSWASRAQHSELSGPETLRHPLLWPAATCDILHYSLVLSHHLDTPGTGVPMGSRAQHSVSVSVPREEIKKGKPNQPQPRYQQLRVSTWQEKLNEVILIILKHHGDNTYRQEGMAQQTPSKVPTGVQVMWAHAQIMHTPWLFSLHSDRLVLALVSAQLAPHFHTIIMPMILVRFAGWLCRLCSF